MSVPRAMQPLVSVWSHRNYAWFMGGMTPNLVTIWMQRMGLLWLAWELTGSNAWVGLVVAADYAPMIVLAPFVGAFVDRANPVTVQKITQWLTLALSALLAVFTFTGLMNIWLLLALVAAQGCLHPFNAVARHAIVPITVPKSEIPTALACDSAIFNAARFVGPALAGSLIPFFGVGITFLANAIGTTSYLAGLYAMDLAPPERKSRVHRGIEGMLKEIKEGVSYVASHPGMGPVFLLLTIGSIWIRPLQDLLPGFADQVFASGAAGLGWLTAGMGVGAMISATGVAMYGRTSGLTLIFLLAFLVNMLATLAFIASPSLWLAIVVGTLWGGSLTLMTTATQAVVQSAVDPALRARVMSLYSMIYRGAPFLGALVIGAAADIIGLRLAFLAATLICVLPWLSTMARRHQMTLAMEGAPNDLGARMMAVAKGLGAMQYERLADVKAAAHDGRITAPLRNLAGAGISVASRASKLMRRARIRQRTGLAVRRTRMAMAEVRSRLRDLRPDKR